MRCLSLFAGLALLAAGGAVWAGDTPIAPIHVPLTLQGGLPTARASVAGHPVSLVLDLGAYQILGLESAALAGVPVDFSGDADQWRDADGHVFSSRLFRAKDLRAGGLQVGELDGNELSGAIGKAALAQDGLIGFGLLRSFQLVFDEPKGELRLYPSSAAGVLRRECGSDGGPVHEENGVLVSIAVTEDGPLRVQWDTGAAENVLRPSALAARKPDVRFLRRLRFDRFDVAGGSAGPQDFVLRQFAAPDVDAVLGTGFFAAHVVCLDPMRGRVAFR